MPQSASPSLFPTPTRGLPGLGGPDAIVHTPESLLVDPTLSREAKRSAMRVWLEQGAAHRDAELCSRVRIALRVLER